MLDTTRCNNIWILRRVYDIYINYTTLFQKQLLIKLFSCRLYFYFFLYCLHFYRTLFTTSVSLLHTFHWSAFLIFKHQRSYVKVLGRRRHTGCSSKNTHTKKNGVFLNGVCFIASAWTVQVNVTCQTLSNVCMFLLTGGIFVNDSFFSFLTLFYKLMHNEALTVWNLFSNGVLSFSGQNFLTLSNCFCLYLKCFSSFRPYQQFETLTHTVL